MSTLFPIGSSQPGALLFHPNSEIADFHTLLQSTVGELGLAKKNWHCEEWADVAKLMTADVMEHAFSQRDQVIELFGLRKPEEEPAKPSMEQLLRQRALHPAFSQMAPAEALPLLANRFDFPLYYQICGRLRSPERLQSSLEEMEREQAKGMSPPFFKAFSGTLAFAIPCWNLPEFKIAIDRLKETVSLLNGDFYIQGASETRFAQFVGEQGEWIDLIQVVYAHLPDIGLIEFRVAHPFVCHAFDRASELKEHPELKGVKPNLWSGGFYNLVKRYLLDEANGLFSGRQAFRKERREEILEKAAAIHGAAEISEELQYILQNI